jgi:hypothetical protein
VGRAGGCEIVLRQGPEDEKSRRSRAKVFDRVVPGPLESPPIHGGRHSSGSAPVC